MPLLEAIPFLKGAVARSLPGGAPSTYTFHDGWVFARSAAVLAAFPVPHMLGTFGLSADDLEAAVGRMLTEPEVGAGDGTLVLRAGRLRSSIELFAAEPPGGLLHETNWEPPPAGLIPAIARAQPFMSHEGTWQRGVDLKGRRARAFSNAHAVEVDVPELEVDGPTALTDDAVGYLAKLDEPSGFKRLPGALGLSWPSGAWVRCQLMAQEWPDVVGKVMEMASAETPVEISAEWREAFADIVALGEGTVDLSPDALVGSSAHATHRAEFATGASRETRWHLRALSHVVAVATHWAPDATGKVAAFRGEGCRGIIAGMTR